MLFTHTHTHTHMRTNVHIHTYTPVHTHTRTPIPTHIHTKAAPRRCYPQSPPLGSPPWVPLSLSFLRLAPPQLRLLAPLHPAHHTPHHCRLLGRGESSSHSMWVCCFIHRQATCACSFLTQPLCALHRCRARKEKNKEQFE